MLKTLLIEIGVEELPAIPLLNELKNIEKKYINILEKHRLNSSFEFYYTPRRLVIWHKEFPATQTDSTEEFFGAPLEVAYKDGVVTPAAIGFAKKCSIDVADIQTATKDGKEVIYCKKELIGKESKELLGELINEWISSLDFGKSMRWGSLKESFIRPIRWVNVMLDNRLVDIELFGVKSSSITFAHRISNFNALNIATAQEYFQTLKDGGVTIEATKRREKILNDFAAIERTNDITIEIDGDLLEEVVAITENPTAILGKFDEEFLRLPPEVIITSMKEHQRYFPVFKNGSLINGFIVVSNALTNDFSKVIEGNERVLRPRLSDALFFYNNDLARGLSTDGLEKVIFMKGLGSVADKIQRELKIAHILFETYTPNGDKEALKRSILLAKADLTSEMVYEFTELQGIMGYYYAKALGESDEVALAIKEQYLPNGEESALPSSTLSAIVAMSIKLDTLISLFSINQIPTGSRDPFALRRAVNGIVKICLEHNMKFDIKDTIASLLDGYDDFEVAKLEQFFLERLRQYFKVNPSIIEAVLATGEREIVAISKKIEALSMLAKSGSFEAYLSTFKRVANITKDMKLNSVMPVDESLFEENAERELFVKFNQLTSISYGSYEQELEALFSLQPELNSFFDSVMVNAPQEALKNNRKSLVALVYKAIFNIADIKEVSF